MWHQAIQVLPFDSFYRTTWATTNHGLYYLTVGRTTASTDRKGKPFRALDHNKLCLIALSIRDAILFTRELGQRYLWFDCLCIIQGDDLDKAGDIEKMADVYEGAIFTISAFRAASSMEDSLSKQIPLPPTVAIQASHRTAGNGFVQLISCQTHVEPVEQRV
jgi:hypothetical protein